MRRGQSDSPDSPQALRRAARIERIRAMQAERMTNAEIAKALNIRRSTLETFIGKWGVHRRPRA